MNGIEIDKFLKNISLKEECPWHSSKFCSWQKTTPKRKGIIGEELIQKFILPDWVGQYYPGLVGIIYFQLVQDDIENIILDWLEVCFE